VQRLELLGKQAQTSARICAKEFAMSLSKVVLVLAASAALASPAYADPAVGLGVSIAFGGGQVQSGVGLRVFSDDEDESTVGTIGVDYMFQSQSWRATVGAAYLNDDAYIGLDLGYGFNGGGVSYGLSGGLVDTTEETVTIDGGEEIEVLRY